MKKSIVLLLLITATTPALAHDGRCAKAEYGPELARALALSKLCLPHLVSAAERDRGIANQQIYQQYHRVPPPQEPTRTRPAPAESLYKPLAIRPQPRARR